MSLWNPENAKDVAESVGIASLNPDVAENLARDVDYRLAQILENALQFMRHGRRTVLSTQDISNALRVLEIEPLYGYESTRPLRFGEASIGPGQPLFYVEDEEVDFEKIINAPLPKVPREISFTAHWLAIEGVQPTIPQNPTPADSRNQDLLAKGPGANSNLAAMSGTDNASVKPLVKHILSKELQLYFDQICGAILNEANEEDRVSSLASLRNDPGLHQLVPYFVQFVAEKVTHNAKNLFVLTQMMHIAEALLENESLYLNPYVAALVPPILTCLIGRRLGDNNTSLRHYDLRSFSASLLGLLCKKYAESSHNLKPRLARTCLKQFLDPNKSSGTHYGAILGLDAIGGADVTRALIIPNLKSYEQVLQDNIADDSPRKKDAEMVLEAIFQVLKSVEKDYTPMSNGYSGEFDEELKKKLADKIGGFVTLKIISSKRVRLAHAILASQDKIKGL
ncbi:MAG: hypothetical protein M1834_005120 [Cirrosporium novae-zelandiae]|nr:MAG: hypothetical protein M1834_005120 [Cirrosporium novae-zelandiae]